MKSFTCLIYNYFSYFALTLDFELNDDPELDPELEALVDEPNEPIDGFTARFRAFFPFCEFLVLDEDDPDDSDEDGDFPELVDVLTEPIDGFKERCKTFSDDDSDGFASDACEDFAFKI